MTMTVAPPVVQPSPGLMALMQGVAASEGSRRRALRPCFELLCTNMLSETANTCPSTLTVVDTTTWGESQGQPDWGPRGAPSGAVVGNQQLEASGWMLEFRVTGMGKSFSPSETELVEGRGASWVR